MRGPKVVVRLLGGIVVFSLLLTAIIFYYFRRMPAPPTELPTGGDSAAWAHELGIPPYPNSRPEPATAHALHFHSVDGPAAVWNFYRGEYPDAEPAGGVLTQDDGAVTLRIAATAASGGGTEITITLSKNN